jgi:hypothetical protein
MYMKEDTEDDSGKTKAESGGDEPHERVRYLHSAS